jgi:hypothetical protein
MRKLIPTLTVTLGALLLAGAAHAGFTLFDMAKDAMYIARGEFVGLQRTTEGDRLNLRVDRAIKGELETGTEIVIEPFEKAPWDVALGHDVIVAFNLMDGKYYFLNHPFGWRSFYHHGSDVAEDGLDRNEQALRRLVAINEPYRRTVIEPELRKRLTFQDMGYAGDFTGVPQLMDAWKAELLEQMSWAGSWAARDAAKVLTVHSLFCFPSDWRLNDEEIRHVGLNLVPNSAVGSIERAYMLELVRRNPEAHPALPVLMNMLREETSQACVGKLAVLFYFVSDRAVVIQQLGELAIRRDAPDRPRINALQVLGGLRDATSVPYLNAILETEVEMGAEFNKPVVRAALKTMHAMPHASMINTLEMFLASGIASESWELTRRAWLAYAKIDNDHTNALVDKAWREETNPTVKRFLARIQPETKLNRDLIMIHNEG